MVGDIQDKLKSLSGKCIVVKYKIDVIRTRHNIKTNGNRNQFDDIVNNRYGSSKALLDVLGGLPDNIEGDDLEIIQSGFDVTNTYLGLIDQYAPFREVETGPNLQAYFPGLRGPGAEGVKKYVYDSKDKLEEIAKVLGEHFPGNGE